MSRSNRIRVILTLLYLGCWGQNEGYSSLILLWLFLVLVLDLQKSLVTCGFFILLKVQRNSNSALLILDLTFILKILANSLVIFTLFHLYAGFCTFDCFDISLIGWVMLWSSLSGPLFENWLGLVGAFLSIFCDAWPHLGADEDWLWRPSFHLELRCWLFGLCSRLCWLLWVLLRWCLRHFSTTPTSWSNRRTI